MKVTDCPECGRRVGLARPMPERGRTRKEPVLRTMRHRRPDGGQCLITPVAEVAVYEVDRVEHERSIRSGRMVVASAPA